MIHIKIKIFNKKIEQDILDAAVLSSNKKIKIPLRKPSQSFKQYKQQNQDLNASLDSLTDDQSLNPMQTIYTDKLLEKQYTDRFSKTIKAIQKINNQKMTLFQKYVKLEGISPI
ncbi:unnamed protein product (macronuclear) [Paramecium tetraurelia]|uniref:Uncharacterized protein n=1 Tax=Paramecium tetraurelia TaxID=5888 RepID=A0CKM6_PARTE|nr:uncharacterized protein GSPATT00001057001 [Paramecium tetraurelia]CAK71343.1 unnamed protein product [Paramecium tetraurelia]|eukprot:XP_001438740.1 hypothetical protein (macronuclear) [Paramecium tetraurelia strain d4-2]